MTHSQRTPTSLLTISFASTTFTAPNKEPVYSIHLNSSAVGNASGEMSVPFNMTTWRAVQFALEPNFDPHNLPKELQPHLEPLGNLARLKPTIGDILGEMLLASPDVRSLFDRALAIAAADRQTLPVELRFGEGCDELAALPWELIRYEHRFLVGDTSIALSRYPEGLIPPTPTLADLPLRVLLVVSEPLDASPILPDRAREELRHGLRSLDEEGAVIVDELKPPTFDTLVEAVRNGQYHMLIFYGHGGHGKDGGVLLFEDEFGRGDRVPAAEVGAALRNTEVRLVLLGACKSATVNPLPSPPPGRFAKEKEQFGDGEGEGQIWQGTAAALVKAGVPLALGMQVNMRVDAAQAFLKQFALSLAAGKEITEAVADARLPILRSTYGESWFIPALYGRPKDGQRLFDATKTLPPENAELRTTMKETRNQIEQLERTIGSVGVMGQGSEIAELRAARQRFADARFELARNTDGGYHQVTSPLYGVPPQKLFVGRSDEMMEVGRALKQNNPVVIWGVGGLGKSALATEVVYRQSWRFPGGVLWLDCQNGPPFESLLERIAAFCGVADLNKVSQQGTAKQDSTIPGSTDGGAATVDQKVAVVRTLLAQLEERCLLIWDNAEDVWTDSSTRSFIQSQLPANVQSILTTRVDPDQTNWPTIEIGPLAEPIMHELFVALAAAKGIKIDLDVLEPMLTWLEGHPYALELLIPLAKRSPFTKLWADMQKKPLKGIEAAFDISYQGLTSDQQRLFARLSVFTIAFEYTAAAALLPEHYNTDENLDTLVQRALIHFDGGRYSYHALVRQFAYQQLQVQIDDVTAMHKIAAQYLLDEANERPRTPDEFLEEVNQWERARQWMQMAQRAVRLVHSLGKHGFWTEIDERLRIAQSRIQRQEDSQSLTGMLLNARGAIAVYQARWENAILYFDQSLHTMKKSGNIKGQAQSNGHLGSVYWRKGEWDKSISYLEQSLQIYEQVGDICGMANPYNTMGLVYKDKGEWDKAISFYEQALQIYEQVDDIRSTAAAYNNLGLVYKDKGEWGKAISFYEQSLQIYEQVDDIHLMAQTISNLGLVYKAKGEWDKAISFYEQSLQAKEKVGDIHSMASTYINLGNVYDAKSEWDKAISFYEQSLQINEQVGDSQSMATAYNNLGNSYRSKDEVDKAIFHHEKSLQIYEQVGDIHGMAQCYNNLCIAYCSNREWDKAISYGEQSLQIKEQVGDIHGMAQTYNNLGATYAGIGDWDKAIFYFEQDLKISEQVGDIHGMAQTYTNLGSAYEKKGDWDKAIAYFEKSLPIDAKIGDNHGMAITMTNMGILLIKQQKNDDAKPLLAQAYVIFAQTSAPETQWAGGNLVKACGSPDAAAAVLQQMFGGESASSPPAQEEEGIALEQLLALVVQARQGEHEIGKQLYPMLQDMAANAEAPPEYQELAKVLTRVLIGINDPDLSSLPEDLATMVRDMLAQL
ncbi:MAG: tetratricopeptide repeat protein [Chloroflexota bacterium]